MNKVQFPRKNTASLSSLEGALISTVKTSDPETFQNTFLVTILNKILVVLRIFLQIPFYCKTSGMSCAAFPHAVSTCASSFSKHRLIYYAITSKPRSVMGFFSYELTLCYI